MSLLWAVLLIGLLITVHEVGHFVAAKLLDVKVLRLSIGLGPRLLGFRHGETEYRLSALLLGGYVEMVGEDPNAEIAAADRHRSFAAKPLWKKTAIVLAGPLANLVFPAVIYFHFYAGQSVSLDTVVGTVLEGQPVDGVLQPGDRITAIDGQAVRYWEEVNRRVQAAPGRDLRFTIERPGEDKPLVKVLTPRAHTRRDLLGKTERIGLIGAAPHIHLAQIGIARLGKEQSPAGRAGLKTFDIVTSAQGRPIGTWQELEALLARNRGEALVLTYLRPQGTPFGFASLERLEPGSVQLFPERVVDNGRARYETGLRPGELFVHDVEPGSPAALAGIAPGDALTSLDGQPLHHWELLGQAFESQPERPFLIGWRTGEGEARQASVRLQPRTERDAYQTESTLYVLGARPATASRPASERPIEGRLFWAAGQAARKTAEIAVTMARILTELLAGRVPATAIGGPIMLYHIAGVAAAHGTAQFLAMVALISLNLGLLNLLPVPILDGGAVLLLGVEALRRRPLGRRARDRAAYVGLAFLSALVLLAARNDILRYL